MISDKLLNPIIRLMILSEALLQEQYGMLTPIQTDIIRCIHQGTVEIYSGMKLQVETFEREDWQTLATDEHQVLRLLTTLINRSQSLLLLKDTLKLQQEDKIQEVRHSSRFLQLQIKNLTDYAQLQNEPDFPLRRYKIEQLLATFSTFPMIDRPITMNWSIAPDLPDVNTNRYCFHRSLESLIANAVVFTTIGRITVGVFPTKEHLEVRVSDTGIGIAETDLAQLFAPFWQGSEKADGLGLGLTVAKALIVRQNGTLHVESTSGVGSTCTMTVPYN